MSSTSQKVSNIWQALLSSQTLVIAGIVWGFVSLMFFLLFSATIPGADNPSWYVDGTYVLELGAFLFAGLLCLRNWLSPRIVSGRNVWAGICIGMFSYLIAGLLFGLWERLFQLSVDVSPADFFYLLSYVAIGISMILAVISRRLNLEIWQWAVLAGIIVAGTAFAIWLSNPQEVSEVSGSDSAAVEEIAPNNQTEASPETSSEASPEASDEPVTSEETTNNVPQWAKTVDQQLAPVADTVNLFYIIADVFLLVIATALLLAFWGGKSSRSWQMIAFATFCLFIADMWFKYADTRLPDYQSGALLEVFYVLAGVLFWIGAALEYSLSMAPSRSRRARRRTTRA